MNHQDIIAQELKGKAITKFYRTRNPNSTFYFDGLGNLGWFKLIIETDNQDKYNLGEDFIEKWESKQILVEIKLESYDKIRTSTITDLIFEKEYDGVYLKLQNKYVIYHDTSFGSEFIIEKYEEVFDESGKLI